ncbi:hypothetical protein BH23PLA1_BH23PLA1_29770 [soil metagenome]
MDFEDLRGLLDHLGFAERIREDHHIFTRDNVEEILNLQRKGKLAKPYAEYETQETAWRRIQRALSLWREDGTLNDRAQADAEIAAALPALTGRAWAKLRRYLAHPASLSFLDRVHEQLEQAEPDSGLRGELVRLWWLRHERRGGPAAAAVVQRLVCEGLSADWGPSYRRVASVLQATVRASSAVEGLNSVLRMPHTPQTHCT